MFVLRRRLSNSESHEFFLAAGVAWLITAVTATVSFLACYAANFKFATTLFPLNLAVALLSLGVFVVYVLFRNDFVILSISNAVATISSFSSAGALFSYVSMHYSLSFDLKDATFASVDELFHLDWPSMLRWVDAHQSIAHVLNYGYASIIPQAIAAVIILSLMGEYRRLHTLVLAFQISALCCAAIATFLPAVGEYTFRKINTAYEFRWLPSIAISYVSDVIQLRTRMPVIHFDKFLGVITFPSFHTSLGILFWWAFWRIPVLRWISFILNGTLILATPIFGGHYFVDVAAGVLVAIGSILVARVAMRSIKWYSDMKLKSHARLI
jgi:hypothetical protein